jgi:hypothetical protein
MQVFIPKKHAEEIAKALRMRACHIETGTPFLSRRAASETANSRQFIRKLDDREEETVKILRALANCLLAYSSE